MATQLFGTIETSAGVAESMLCIDTDQPSEAMIHRYGRGIEPAAVLAEISRSGNRLELVPRLIYRPSESGGLYLPVLSKEDITWRDESHATLVESTDGLTGEWSGPNSEKGRIEFPSPKTSEHVVAEQCGNWQEFKLWCTRVRAEKDAFYFRGHGSNAFRLRSTLHRAGRMRLERYCQNQLRDFTQHAEAALEMRLNLSDGADYATVLGLAQHHGLPTPMLDWTGSPYVAAFFAFSDALESIASRPDVTHVRVLALTRKFVVNTSPAVVTIPQVAPYVASLSISPRSNPRLYAQRGQFLVTNVADVESFLRSIEKEVGEQVLFAVDVPTHCATEAIEDLEYMGLSAATLFPGLDGVCRMMKHQMSFKRPPVRPNSVTSPNEQREEAHDISDTAQDPQRAGPPNR